MRHDTAIIDGFVIDGTGSEAFKANIGIIEDRIQTVTQKPISASRVIQAKGLFVSPGFIDVHSHSDSSLLVSGLAESKIRQGVTTEVIGNCGHSIAPVTEEVRRELVRTSELLRRAEVEWGWSDVRGYLQTLEEGGVSINVAMLVGHGTIRGCVMGFGDDKPSSRDLRSMRKLAAEAVGHGAVGLSTGLIYPPGCYAETEEIIEVCRGVSGSGGLYATHMRDEGGRLIDSVKESLRIGSEASLPVEISHHKAVGERNWGKVRGTTRMIRQAREKGLDVTCDVYPYTASATSLSALLPQWAHVGGTSALMERLKTKRVKERIVKHLATRNQNWSRVLVSYSKERKEFEGKNVAQISRMTGRRPPNAVIDLIIQDYGTTGMIKFGMIDQDVQTVLRQPFTMIGSDSRSVSPRGILGEGKPHPRTYGTFPRVIARYARKLKVISLEEAVRKMTSLPARKFGLEGRGLIKPGYFADLAIFNFETIRDRATYEEPSQFPEGIPYVIVNGKVSVQRGGHTKAKSGTVLRGRGRQNWKS